MQTHSGDSLKNHESPILLNQSNISNTMNQVQLRQIKQGEFFKLQPTDSAPVWVRGYYCREDKTFEAYKYDDTNREGFFKGTKRVFVDFEF